jgi:UDP-glucuronate 4-epimerase
MLRGESIPVFNNGDMSRDFTYIDDIVEGVLAVLDRPRSATPGRRAARRLQYREQHPGS